MALQFRVTGIHEVERHGHRFPLVYLEIASLSLPPSWGGTAVLQRLWGGAPGAQ